MVDIKRFAMAGGALMTAASIGFVMQSGEAAPYAQASFVPDISGTQDDPLEVTDITLTAAPTGEVPSAESKVDVAPQPEVLVETPKEQAPSALDQDVVRVAALGDTPNVEQPAEADGPLVNACDVSMDAIVKPAALVDVSVTAPCFPNERLTLHHNGMMFTAVTDEDGKAAAMVPALTSNAIFIAAFANGEGALASAQVTELDRYDRKVVQSKANGHLHINAFEFGADYRDAGHVSVEAERGVEYAIIGDGGFISSLGDSSVSDALVAEVYTFPTNTATTGGEVFVSVEAEVTTDNCGLRIEAQTLEVSQGGTVKVQDLSLPIPACDAVGDFLVLQNLLGDLKVAQN